MTSTTLTQITPAAGQDVPINGNFQAVSPSALYARRYGSGISGLVLGYYGGTFEGNDIADGTTTLAASQATIYVVALKSTGVVSSSTSSTNWDNTSDYFRIGIATTGAATITGFVDKRQAYSVQPSGSMAWGDLTGIPAPIDDIAALTDPGADRILFWDDSAGIYTHLAVGSGLSLSGTTLTATGGGSGDVVGPASAVDDRIATFDTTTGKLIQDGGKTIAELRVPAKQEITTAATITPTFLNDLVLVTALAEAATIANPTGTAIDGLGIVIRIKDNGTARALTYGSQYRAIGVTLPTTTVVSKTLYLAMIWNATDTKFDVIAVGQE